MNGWWYKHNNIFHFFFFFNFFRTKMRWIFFRANMQKAKTDTQYRISTPRFAEEHFYRIYRGKILSHFSTMKNLILFLLTAVDMFVCVCACVYDIHLYGKYKIKLIRHSVCIEHTRYYRYTLACAQHCENAIDAVRVGQCTRKWNESIQCDTMYRPNSLLLDAYLAMCVYLCEYHKMCGKQK